MSSKNTGETASELLDRYLTQEAEGLAKAPSPAEMELACGGLVAAYIGLYQEGKMSWSDAMTMAALHLESQVERLAPGTSARTIEAALR